VKKLGILVASKQGLATPGFGFAYFTLEKIHIMYTHDVQHMSKQDYTCMNISVDSLMTTKNNLER